MNARKGRLLLKGDTGGLFTGRWLKYYWVKHTCRHWPHLKKTPLKPR